MTAKDADLLSGLKAIGEYLNRTPEQVRHLIRTAGLPAFTLGERNVSARKTSLDAWLADCEAKAREGRANG